MNGTGLGRIETLLPAPKRVCLLAAALGWLLTAALPCVAMEWERTETSLALHDGQRVVWRFNAGPEAGKPFFHPLNMSDGTALSDHRPADHPWHLGLWFVLPKVNHANFWGEGKDGKIWGGSKVEVARLEFSPREDFSAQIELDLNWVSGAGDPLLMEKRTIDVSAPGAEGYSITSRHRLTAPKDAVIAKNDYGGFSFRGGPALRAWRWVQAAPVKMPDVPAFTPRGAQMQPARWMGLVEAAANGRARGIAILDHPSNPRHPSQWHGIVTMPFFCPAFLADRDFARCAGETVELRYRFLVFSGQNPTPYLEAQHAAFGQTKEESVK